MVKTISRPGDLGARMPAFTLPCAHGHTHTSTDLLGANGTLVMIICNHCPYVQHIADSLAELTGDLAEIGISTIAINPNDPAQAPEDSPEGMRAATIRYRYQFPYLIDETQDIARAFGAVCTPDIFLFDRGQRLYYRGQLDDSRPGNYLTVTGDSLKSAVADMLSGKPAPTDQKPSLGCSIKWRTDAPNEDGAQPLPSTTKL
ncbi:peroxiredoxin [Nocardia sp. GAS34]|uniref:thioredoxin family protein n=1 Tax=unclassified Nocardia TaxID=2637762 RepID=UPI003D201E5E